MELVGIFGYFTCVAEEASLGAFGHRCFVFTRRAINELGF
jgi:hypothetical protein